jgi:signal transduction histidine kinase
MALFIEHLLEADHRWATQVIQHALSLHSHLPLRLIDRKKIFNGLPSDFPWCNVAEVNITNLTSRLPIKLLKDLDNRDFSPWLTIPSNLHPFVRYLRRRSFWRGAEQYLVRNWLNTIDHNQIDITRYFHDAMIIATYPIKINMDMASIELFLVVGPVFNPPRMDSEEVFLKDRVKPFVDDLMSTLPKRLTMDHYLVQELEFLGSARGWLSKERLINKTLSLGRVIENLFNIDCDITHEINLERCTYNSLAQILFLLHQGETIRIINDITKSVQNPIFFDIVQQRKRVDRTLPTKLVLQYANGKYILGGDTSLTRTKPHKVWIESNELLSINQDVYNKLLNRLETMWDDLALSYATLHYGYTNDSLMRFWNWLTDEFGLVFPTAFEPVSQNGVLPMYQRIAREITFQFTADVCTIYRYNYSKRVLEHQVSTFQEKLVDKERREWTKALKDVMDKAAINPIKRAESICYRCADAKQSRFCRAWDPDTNLTDPYGEPFLNPDSHHEYTPYKSVIAVPMIVNRRLFGVLEIAGFSSYQFRFSNLNLAQDVGNVLGAFLHHKEVLGALHNLCMNILDHQIPDKDKYDKICQEFSKIFFADAATFYVSRTGAHGEYKLTGWHNRDDLDRLSPDKLDTCILTENRKDSPLMIAFRSTKWRSIFELKELKNKYPGWSRAFLPRKELFDRFDWQVAIPVSIPKGVSESRNLGGLYLYYKNHPKDQNVRPIIAGWELTIKFMSDYVALLLEAMESRKKIIESHMIQHFLRHELKQKVDSVSQRAEDIVNFLKLNSPQVPFSISKTINFLNKDLLSSQMALSKMVSMLQSESFEKLTSHRLDPIKYLITQGGKVDLIESAEEIHIRALFNEIWSSIILNKEYSDKGIRFIFSGPMRGPVIKANRNLVRWIFDNLFINAAKYSLPNSCIEVKIEVTKYSFYVHLINAAKSISLDEEKSIFEYGFRGSNIGNQNGDGLGLTVARSLCEDIEAALQLDIIDKTKNGISLFDFTVVFPRQIMINNK